MWSSYSLMTSALDRGVWSASRPGSAYPLERTPVPIVQEAGWAPEPVWTQRVQEESVFLCRGSNLDRPVVSLSVTFMNLQKNWLRGTKCDLLVLLEGTVNQMSVCEYILKVSMLYIYSLEDGDNMFFRNASITYESTRSHNPEENIFTFTALRTTNDTSHIFVMLYVYRKV
jgi:hypothetical protein